jgi:hypothetical protein
MAEIISLSRAHKGRDRLKKQAQADANAAKFGRTKAERTQDDQTADKARRDLDGHARDPE